MVARLKWIGVLALAIVPLLTLVPSRADAKASEDEEEGKPKKPDADCPKWTAGALFTRDTYPSNEVDRPLNLTGGMIEGRLDLQTTSRKVELQDIHHAAGGPLRGQRHPRAAGGRRPDARREGGPGQAQEHLRGGAAIDPARPSGGAAGVQDAGRSQVPVRHCPRVSDQVPHRSQQAGDRGAGRDHRHSHRQPGGGRGHPQAQHQHLDRRRVPDPRQSGGAPPGAVRINLDDTDLTEIPVQLDLQYTPVNLFDFGLFIALDNLKAKDPEKPFDRRSIGLFARARY